MLNKLVLGTVQFGQKYGIANKRGKIPKDEVLRILEYACNLGITILDTAHLYGKSEQILGECIKKAKSDFKLISKLAPSSELNYKKVKDIVCKSIHRLERKNVYGYLIHEQESEDFMESVKLWNILVKLKKKRLVKKIGFSLYKPEELELIFEKAKDCDIVQIPYSIFDRRFGNYLKILKENNIEIHVRSIFLQGLVFLNPKNLPVNLIRAKPYIEKLQNLALENNIAINTLCLDFVLLNPSVDKVVIGVDSLEHLKKDIKAIGLIEKVRSIYNELEKLNIEDKDIILPYRWSEE